MTDALAVYLHGDHAGVLERESQAKLRFAYTPRWAEAGRAPISLSLPVCQRAYGHDESAPFFEGLLPEGNFLRGSPPEHRHRQGADPGRCRLGCQRGFLHGLRRKGGPRRRPVRNRVPPGTASTCWSIATTATSPVEPDGRLHQEDFCQALGLVPGVKYENEGGPDVADCARLIHRHSGAPARDIIAFLDALLFNFLIGNNDAHSKNYSLLLDGPGAIRLAPLYDLLSTATIEGAGSEAWR